MKFSARSPHNSPNSIKTCCVFVLLLTMAGVAHGQTAEFRCKPGESPAIDNREGGSVVGPKVDGEGCLFDTKSMITDVTVNGVHFDWCGPTKNGVTKCGQMVTPTSVAVYYVLEATACNTVVKFHGRSKDLKEIFPEECGVIIPANTFDLAGPILPDTPILMEDSGSSGQNFAPPPKPADTSCMIQIFAPVHFPVVVGAVQFFPDRTTNCIVGIDPAVGNVVIRYLEIARQLAEAEPDPEQPPDVPAVKRSHLAPLHDCGPKDKVAPQFWHTNLLCGGEALLTWTCADKSRILLTDTGDGKKWCHMPQGAR